MKKVIMFILINMLIFNFNTTALANNDTNHIEGEIACYYIPETNFENFYRLVQNSEGTPYNLSLIESVYSTYNSERGNCVEMTFYTPDGIPRRPCYTYEDDEYGWENWVIRGSVIGIINPETINYLGYKDNIKNILAQNNVNCTVNDYMVISVSYDIPSIIWVNTDMGYYYIMFEYDYPENASRIEYESKNNLVYKVYDAADFLKVLSYQDADIFVDDKKISNQNYYSKIRGNIAHMSLRTVLEALGSTVTWDDENQAVIFTCGNDTYIVNTSDSTPAHQRVLACTEEDEYKPVFWSDRIWLEMIDDRIVVNHDEIKYFARLFGKNTTVDFENLIINFK